MQKNGFDLTDALIPEGDVLSGGPPKDGIPSIDNPSFVALGETSYGDDDEVLGVVHNGIVKAYPIGIMNWHEIVNDFFGDAPVAITFCPLCGSGISYEATIDGTRTEFGVSGLLFNSDVLLYDRNTDSLWSQIMSKGVSGKMKGTELITIPTQHTTLGVWKKAHPDTLVLDTKTGFSRDYTRSPYSGYAESDSTFFPVANSDERLSKKEWVIGVEQHGAFKAYPRKTLLAHSGHELKDTVGGVALTISWDETARSVDIVDEKGTAVVGLGLFWFAWAAFHPDTEVWSG